MTGLFLFIAIVAGLVVIASVVARRSRRGVTALITTGVAMLAYLTVDEVPESLTQSLPYVVTLVVLATASQRLRPPARAGVPSRPGGRH